MGPSIISYYEGLMMMMMMMMTTMMMILMMMMMMTDRFLHCESDPSDLETATRLNIVQLMFMMTIYIIYQIKSNTIMMRRKTLRKTIREKNLKKNGPTSNS